MVRKTGKKKMDRKTGVSFDALNFPSYDEVISDIEKKVGRRPPFPKNLAKGNWTEQSLKVLSERYLRKNDREEIIETPEEMCWRVAWEAASAEAKWGKGRREITLVAKDFYELLVTHEFLPNSPTLMNAGTGNGLQYSACFVLPVEDSLVGIFDSIKHQALIHQTGGGTGFSFSRLRPKGSVVKSSKGTASGPVSFMRIFDAATNEIKQGGKRRGANMGILRVDHPDIMEFIHCKDGGGITNFNISVAVTDKFMKAYKEEKDYDLADPRTKKVVGRLSAQKVFDEIAESAWKTGDPGLVFIDRINVSTANPVPAIGPIESTNPCGEQPLYPWDSCNLGSIFLTYFVKDVGGKKEVDWEKLKVVTRLSVRFLDNVIEMNPYPLEAIRRVSLAIRRIGLGVGGWADMLIELGIPYDSEEALGLGEKIMKTIQAESLAETGELAKERGPFPLWPVSIYKKDKPRRNSTLTTIAPTGSISIIAGASSGIEPLFAIAFQHIVKDKDLQRTLSFFDPKFEKIMQNAGFWNDAIKEKVSREGVIRDIGEIPESIRRIFATAHEIDHTWHIKHQAAFQKYTENAVSKTINMTNGTSVQDIKDVYLLAWKTNCKGITVFRDGCKDAQVLNLGVVGNVKEKKDEPIARRPFMVKGATYRLNTPVGTAFVTINEDEGGEPLELFINVGKAGSDVTAMAEALGRTISTGLRFRGALSARDKAKEIALQLAGIGGRRSVGFGLNKILSLPDAIAFALSSHFGFKVNGFVQGGESTANGQIKVEGLVEDKLNITSSPKSQDFTNGGDAGMENEKLNLGLYESSTLLAGDICPSCGAGSFIYQEGCAKCYSCGYSEC